MKRNQSGFTLIELIVVIVVLGILAATIVPRFTQVQGEARRAVVSGLEASVNSASSMYHGVKLAIGDAAGTAVPQNRFEGVGADVADVNLYPDSTAAGIGALVTGASDFTLTPGAGGAGTSYVWAYTGVTDNTNCRVTYTAPAANNPPTIVALGTSC